MFILGQMLVEEMTVNTLLSSFVSIHSLIKIERKELLGLVQPTLNGEINQVAHIALPLVTGQTVGSFVVPYRYILATLHNLSATSHGK
jgi:hypothetical protein